MPSRHRFDNLTRDQIEMIRAGLRDGLPIRDVAREIGCSPRTVLKYYHRFSAKSGYQPKGRSEKRPRAEPRQPAPREDRFYRSDFVPS